MQITQFDPNWPNILFLGYLIVTITDKIMYIMYSFIFLNGSRKSADFIAKKKFSEFAKALFSKKATKIWQNLVLFYLAVLSSNIKRNLKIVVVVLENMNFNNRLKLHNSFHNNLSGSSNLIGVFIGS